MKFSELWLKSIINKKNIESKKLYNIIISSGFEINSILNVYNNIEKCITGRIENIIFKNNKSIISIYINKYYCIKLTENHIHNINKGDIIVLIFKYKKKIEKKYIFLYSPYNVGISNDKNLVILPKNVKIGRNVFNLLKFNDNIIDLNIPVNRNDCLSLIGVSQEISKINNLKIDYTSNTFNVTLDNKISIKIKNNNLCFYYIGIIIKNINTNISTPIFISERLRRSGYLVKSVIENIINYIILETGCPLNIFNLNDINNSIFIKKLNIIKNININNKFIDIKNKLVLISDKKIILSIPGISNNNFDFIKSDFYNIFLGCGFFNTDYISKIIKEYNLSNELSQKYEKQTNINLMEYAINKTVYLINKICKCNISSLIKSENYYDNSDKKIELNIKNINKKLGFLIKKRDIINILNKLKFKILNYNKKIYVLVPIYRKDLNNEEDLIEDIIKIYKFDNIPIDFSYNNINYFSKKINIRDKYLEKIINFLVYKGYNEIISYSLVNKDIQCIFSNIKSFINIDNPISNKMSTFRTSLITGLINTLILNQNRKNNNIKIFEIGKCYLLDNKKKIHENNLISGIISGYKKDDFLYLKSNKEFDFYDIKGDVESMLLFLYNEFEFCFTENKLLFLEDKFSNAIIDNKKNTIGHIGLINNFILNKLKIKNKIMFFEIYLDKLNYKNNFHINKIYKLPINKKDITISVDNKFNIKDIIKYCLEIKNNNILNIKLIDYYKLNNINNFTIRYYIQNKKNNLIDEEINKIIKYQIEKLNEKFNINKI